MILLAALLAWLVSVSPPATVAQQAPNASTPSITGVVVRAGTGQAIAGARVFALMNGQGGGYLLGTDVDTEPLSFLPQVTTDAQGRFQFADLKPGRYTVTAHRSGFARQQYGARAPGRPGTILTLVAGRPAQHIVLPLLPSGVISGRVTDDMGEPVTRMTVLIQQSAYGPDGRRTLRPAATSRTDDRGEYRAYGLVPGRYYALVSPRRSGSVEIARAGYAATYYPGVTRESQAAAIEVRPGAEVGGIDFTVSRQPVFRVRGRLPDTGTGLRPDLVWLTPTGSDDDGHLEGEVSGDVFEVKNVVPGSYRAHANAGEVPLLSGWVDVSNADVESVVLISDQGTTIDGRLHWEGVLLSSLAEGDRPLVVLDPVDRSTDSQATARVAPDGTWRMRGLADGDYWLRVRLPPGSYLASARQGSTDVLNGLSITGSVTHSLELVARTRAGRLEGTVVDAKGRPMPGIEAVLVPAREADRTPGRVMAAASDQNGRFDLESVPPGDYKLFAWDDLEPYGYFDAEFVRRYEADGTPIRIGQGSRQRVQLTATPVVSGGR